MDLEDRIREVIQEWPQWSRHELTMMDEIEDEIMRHARDGTGNGFIRSWCNRVLVPRIPGMVKT